MTAPRTPRGFISHPCPLCLKEFPTPRIRDRHQAACAETEADARARAEANETFSQLVAAGQAKRKDAR